MRGGSRRVDRKGYQGGNSIATLETQLWLVMMNNGFSLTDGALVGADLFQVGESFQLDLHW